MRVVFDAAAIPKPRWGEIEAVLQRIAVGPTPGRWQTQPDEIRIVARLSGGRSGAEVVEAVVKTGNQKSQKVIKLGPLHEVQHEFHAFQKHLQTANRFFVPIEAVTPALLEKDPQPRSEREAVVYDHAARFIGQPARPTRTFESVARDAVQTGGPQLAGAVSAIHQLFNGIRNDLYDQYMIGPDVTSLHESWNGRLGADATIAVDKVNRSQQRLYTTQPAPHGRTPKEFWPLDLKEASLRPHEKGLPEAIVKLLGAQLSWRGDRLMAEIESHHLRVEIVADGPKDIRELLGDLKGSPTWSIEGRLAKLRTLNRRAFILQKLPELGLHSNTLQGPAAQLPDPFPPLAGVLESTRADRVSSLVHGDLNPRNILLVDDQPCLIDYASTRTGEPIFVDFTRLEGCLARDTLPLDLTWAQHVRLQRLLAWASRLGDEAAQEFSRRLGAERPELGYAFQLLWAIRRAPATPTHKPTTTPGSTTTSSSSSSSPI